jgi:HK97 family phage major capsid protein
MAGIRRVPLLVRLIGATDGTTAYWVGEGGAVPVSSAAFSEDTLRPLKVAALAVITEELLKSSDPDAEAVIREDLIAAMAEAIDLTFLDPANAGVADLKPASVTNGLTPIVSTNPADDLAALIALFDGDLTNAYLIGSPETLARLSSADRPNVGARGGSIAGIPAIASKVAVDTLALIDASAIALGEAEVELKVSREATIEMADNPTNNSVTPTATNHVSLWQANAAGVLTTKAINWRMGRPGAAIVTGIAY